MGPRTYQTFSPRNHGNREYPIPHNFLIGFVEVSSIALIVAGGPDPGFADQLRSWTSVLHVSMSNIVQPSLMHTSVKTQACNICVTRDLDVLRLTLDPRINGFPWFTVAHLCILKSGDHSCIGFYYTSLFNVYVETYRQKIEKKHRENT